MKKISIKNLLAKLQLVAARFPFVLFFVLGLGFLFLLKINRQHIDIKPYLWVIFSLGIFLNLSVSLFAERIKNILLRNAINILSIILLVVYCLTLPDKFESVHFFKVIAIGISFILSIFAIPFLRRENDAPFWEFSKTIVIQSLIAGLFSQVLFAGLSLAILSLKELFKVPIENKIYENLAVICYIYFGPVFLLANLTPKTEMHKPILNFNTFFKILGLYIFLPILALYTLILYVYLFQIIVKWELPNGWVSMLVSVLGLGGFLTMHIVYPLRSETENKLVNTLSKYFSVILLPLLVLMSVGISRRFSDYGITINRLYVIILNVWLYGICIYLFITQSRHIKWIVISFITILFLSSVGPWSVFNITKQFMIKDIGQTLTDSKLLKNGKLIADSAIINKLDSTTSARLSEKINYTRQTYGKQSLNMYFKDTEYKLFSKKGEWFDSESVKVEEVNDSTKYINITVEKRNQRIDLKPYSALLILKKQKNDSKVFEDNDYLITLKNTDIQVFKNKETSVFITISLKQKIDSLIRKDLNQSAVSTKKFEIIGNDYKLVVSKMSIYFNKPDNINLNNIDANLFLK